MRSLNLPAFSLSLLAAALPAQRITVGANVQISKAESGVSHNELLAHAHPTDPNRMIACSQAYRPDSGVATSIVYFSTDNGRSWRKSFEIGNVPPHTDGFG